METNGYNTTTNETEFVPYAGSGIYHEFDVCFNSSESLKSDVFDDIMLAIGFIQGIFISASNALTILAVVRTPKLRSFSNMYVVSLAAMDMVTGILMLYQGILLLPGFKHLSDTDYIVCASIYVILHVTTAGSMLSIVLIAFERFMYICFPFKYEYLSRASTIKASIIITWILAIGFGMVPIFNHHKKSFTVCYYNFISDEFYRLTGFFFFVGLLTSLILYSCIMRVAVKQRKKMNKTVFAASTVQGANFTVKHQMKVIKTFILINILYYVCWFPWVLSSLIRKDVCIGGRLVDIFSVFGMASGGMNFLVYGLLNDDFRRAYKRLLCFPRSNRLGDSDSSTDKYVSSKNKPSNSKSVPKF